MHGASKIIVKSIVRAWIKDFSKTSEDISNISEAWSEWSVNECEIKIADRDYH